MKTWILMVTLLVTTLENAPAMAETIWYPLPAEAYQFGNRYPAAQKLLFAFDYGHALVYERLLLRGNDIPDLKKFEKQILDEIITILKNPPSVKADEADIAPSYAYTFPLTLNLFDWSHLLHQFILDVLSAPGERSAKIKTTLKTRVNELFEQYKANTAVAITDVCKTMLFMDGQRISKDGQRLLQENELEAGAHFFSKTFRQKFPSFNLLIWSYHWFQIKLYEVLMNGSQAERDQGVTETVKMFWKLISNLPDSAEFDMMPETAKEAPTFSMEFPKIPSAFDNNHMMHDVVSDILTSEWAINKRRVGFGVARMAQNPNAFRSHHCMKMP